MARSRVVLPQPDGPRKQTNSLSATSSETSPRAMTVAEALLEVADLQIVHERRLGQIPPAG